MNKDDIKIMSYNEYKQLHEKAIQHNIELAMLMLKRQTQIAIERTIDSTITLRKVELSNYSLPSGETLCDYWQYIMYEYIDCMKELGWEVKFSDSDQKTLYITPIIY